MFRVSQHMREVLWPSRPRPHRAPRGPVVIWNLTRRCNLSCRFCYSGSSNVRYPGELSTGEALEVMKDLRAFGVPALILSGGEPLMRPDIFGLSRAAKAMGFYVALSSNGSLIDEDNIDAVAEMDYDYVGISIDGMRDTHDRLRGKAGAFDAAMRGLALCQQRGLKVGLRFTLTRDNARELPLVIELIEEQGIDKLYLSHLNYGGRGNKVRGEDAVATMTRAAMDLVFETCLSHLAEGRASEIVTGNNDADGVYFLHWVRRSFPERAEHARALLERWGGNASGVNVANIDNRGFVHPDSFWWHHRLGNVRERPFSEIWSDLSDPLMAGLKARPRPLAGRCAVCRYQAICNGNTRVRASRVYNDPWQEDPGCYLMDAEIGLEPAEPAHAAP
jgi:Fe-coproporphyrin III synthase